MAESAIVIDLGLREPVTEADEPVTPWVRPGRRRGRRTLLIVLLSLVLPAATLGASAIARPGLTVSGAVTVRTATTFVVARGLVFTMTPHAGQNRADIEAWTPAGRLRWRASVPSEQVDLHATASTVTVLNNGDSSQVISSFDLATGRPLWSGEPQALALAAVSGRSDHLLVHRMAGERDALDWVDARTGKVLWSWVAPEGAAVDGLQMAPGGEARAITQAGDLITIRADDTGTVTTQHLAGLAPVAAPDYRYITGDHDVIMILDSEVDATEIVAYDAASRRRLWAQVAEGGRFAQPCGPMICEGTGVALQFYDPRDGRYAWGTSPSFARGWGSAMVVQQYTVTGAGRAVIVNPHTGRPTRDLGRWTMIDIWDGDTMLLMSPLASETGQWLGVLRPGDAQVRPLGPVPGIGDMCAMDGDLIACRRFDDRLTLLEVSP